MKILICEDQKILLDGIVKNLQNNGFEVVKGITLASDILKEMKKEKFDVILTDIVTENGVNALDYTLEIKTKYPNTKIITMTGFPDISFMEKAKKNGVDSFVYKNISTEELVNVLKSTYSGYTVFPSASNINKEILLSLTPTEMKVLRLYCNGLERKEIAEVMAISTASLKSHISSILDKTGYQSIARVAIYAVKNGLIIVD